MFECEREHMGNVLGGDGRDVLGRREGSDDRKKFVLEVTTRIKLRIVLKVIGKATYP